MVKMLVSNPASSTTLCIGQCLRHFAFYNDRSARDKVLYLDKKNAQSSGRSKISQKGAHMYNQEFQPFVHTEGGTRFQQGVSMPY
jgi:hypothetical protein